MVIVCESVVVVEVEEKVWAVWEGEECETCGAKKDEICSCYHCYECGEEVEGNHECFEKCDLCEGMLGNCSCFWCEDCQRVVVYEHECGEECRECGSSLEECACEEGEIRAGVDVWELPYPWDVATQAADFCILMQLTLDGVRGAREELEELVERVTPILERYTDMVIGGEARYTYRNAGQEPNPLTKALAGELASEHRARSWRLWKPFRERYGMEALEWAVKSFREMTSAPVGGENWAIIAETLLYRERGQISPIIFLDTVWGLEHNTGIYFSKMPWRSDDGRLRQVLDGNLKGNFESFVRIASREVEKMWEERRNA